jgi:hypothetical protein
MNWQKVLPQRVKKSISQHTTTYFSTGKAGVVQPIDCIPVLRGDRVKYGTVRVNLELNQTVKLLQNAVNVVVEAIYVPMLAFDRFDGLDDLNRAYKGVADGDGVVNDYLRKYAHDPTTAWAKAVGVPGAAGRMVDAGFLESYNTWINHKRALRSTKLPTRDPLDQTLADCLWLNPTLEHIVPDFEVAALDAKVETTMSSGRIGVEGLAFSGLSTGTGESQILTTDEDQGVTAANARKAYVDVSETNGATPRVFIELDGEKVGWDMSSIEEAHRIAAWAARMRGYKHIELAHEIELLMSGIALPNLEMSTPMLVGRSHTRFGMMRRFATDGASLTDSVSDGHASVDVPVYTPGVSNTGGYIIITAEVVPDNIHERRPDYLDTITDLSQLPEAVRDDIDSLRVSRVKNSQIDADHDDKDALFGYAPLHWDYADSGRVRVGGEYYRPEYSTAYDEDRLEIWNTDRQNVALNEDFILATNVTNNVFEDYNGHAFKIKAYGVATKITNTVFGKGLHEVNGEFADVKKLADEIDDSAITEREAAE